MAVFEYRNTLKLTSSKIWATEKSWNFHTVKWVPSPRPPSMVKKFALYRGFKYSVFHLKKYLCSNYVLTVWKFHDYSIDQILREINFGDSRSAKTFFLDTFKDCTFLFSNFHELLHFLKDETHQNNKIQGPKISNNSSIRISRFSKNWFHVKSEWQRNPEISL